MLNQTFTPSELKKLVTDKEIRKFSWGKAEQDILNSVTSISYAVSQSNFEFSNIKKAKIKGKDVFTVENEYEYFAIKRLNHIVKRLYTVTHSNRNEILDQVIEVLNDGCDYKVIRADIKGFFDNISRNKLVKKLKSDSMLGSLMINKLNQLDSSLTSLSCKGLPRGISLSSTLSEIYLRDFDYDMKCHNGVYYYARYVDDMIIICIDNVVDVQKTLTKKLQLLGLELNDKFKIVDDKSKSADFDYLGVNFDFKDKHIKYSLSNNKVKQYKTRIIKSILDYRKNMDDNLLIERIKFITSNYHIFTKTESNNLRAGIYYNNQYINNYTQLNELNEFLRKSLSSKKGSLSKITKRIPSAVVTECLKSCFFKGYINKEMVSYSPKKISNIVRCWDNG